MKKFLACLLVMSSVVAFAAPATAFALSTNGSVSTVVVAESVDPGNEIGGVLPDYYLGRMNSGLIFEFKQFDVTINSIEKTVGNVNLKLSTVGELDRQLGDVFFAIYDAQGKLKYVSSLQKAVIGTNDYNWPVNITYENGDIIRAFVWESETLKPLCESKLLA